jgi:hypothetical protein
MLIFSPGVEGKPGLAERAASAAKDNVGISAGMVFLPLVFLVLKGSCASLRI